MKNKPDDLNGCTCSLALLWLVFLAAATFAGWRLLVNTFGAEAVAREIKEAQK